jgi:hypothetical protein
MKIVRPEELNEFPEIRELTPEELKEAYALAKAAFTADDLQKYTEVEEGFPMEKLIEEIEEAQRKADEKKR